MHKFTLSLLFLLFSSISFATSHNQIIHATNIGVEVAVPEFKRQPLNDYLKFIESDLKKYQAHENQVQLEGLSQFKGPSTAVIVGSGTVGMIALANAAQILPKGSTVLLIQNDTDDTKSLSETITQHLPTMSQHKLAISEPTDLAQLDKIEAFLDENQQALKHTKLYIHTADKAERYIPDTVSYQDALPQIIRRMSVAAINDMIVETLDEKTPFVRILVSSECSQNRSDYKIPNLGAYQIGKVVGDDLFKASKKTDSTYTFITVSGPMATQGQYHARQQEFDLLVKQNIKPNKPTKEQYVEWHFNNVDIEPMDSVGSMFKQVWHALNDDIAKPNVLYAIFGNSVNLPNIQHKELYALKEAEYLWPLLEKPA